MKSITRFFAPILLILYVITIPFPLVTILWRIEHGFYYYVFTSLAFYWADLLAILLLAAGLFAWRWPFAASSWPQRLFTGALVLLLLLTAVSALFAQDPRITFIFLGRLLLLFGVYTLLMYIPLPTHTVTLALSAMLLFHSVVAIGQFLLQGDVGLQFLGEYNLAPEAGYSVVFGQDMTWLRAYGISPHPNIIAGMLVSALAAVFPAYFTAPSRWRPFLLTVISLSFAAICLTFSRSSWLSLALGIGFYAAVQWRTLWRKETVLLASVIAMIGLIFLWQAQTILFARFTPAEGETVTQSVGERALLTDTAWRIVGENGFFGMGAGNFSLRLLELEDEIDFPSIHPVHNIPLLLTAELGWLGGLTWLFLILFPPLYAIYAWYQGELTAVLAGATAALIAIAVIDFFDHYSWNWAQGRMWRWLLFALWVRAASSQDRG